MKIKELPKNDRPRERLINNGASALSNEELLSIILSSGSRGKSVKEEADDLLKGLNDISDLYNYSYQSLIKVDGIGSAKACLILAILELSKRLNSNSESIINTQFNNSSIIYDHYKRLERVDQEHFYCLYLNSKNEIIAEKLLFIGTVNKSLVHPRDVFKEAFINNAVSFICVHNHPSGDPKPSNEDIALTSRLKEIGFICGIKLLDHVIIGKNNFFSFFENDMV